jgi:hypothetical protein
MSGSSDHRSPKAITSLYEKDAMSGGHAFRSLPDFDQFGKPAGAILLASRSDAMNGPFDPKVTTTRLNVRTLAPHGSFRPAGPFGTELRSLPNRQKAAWTS